MKEGIHPQYGEVAVECACGNRFVTRSTVSRIRLEICSSCHPFYTGRQKLFDTAGRVERFEKRFSKTAGKTLVRKPAGTKAAPKLSSAVRKVLRNAPTVVAPSKTGKPKKSPKASPKPPANIAGK
jgi:large subunit ribosomal protein L31